jgi:uncharacterized protein (TIGR03435 family)
MGDYRREKNCHLQDRSAGSGSMTISVRAFHYSPGTVTCDQPLEAGLREAYSVKDWQVARPAWPSSEKYEFAATIGRRPTGGDVTDPEGRLKDRHAPDAGLLRLGRC